ncbi:MAG: hypothetical protein ACTSR8_21820 [Promethearchaeota archaeon]
MPPDNDKDENSENEPNNPDYSILIIISIVIAARSIGLRIFFIFRFRDRKIISLLTSVLIYCSISTSSIVSSRRKLSRMRKE